MHLWYQLKKIIYSRILKLLHLQVLKKLDLWPSTLRTRLLTFKLWDLRFLIVTPKVSIWKSYIASSSSYRIHTLGCQCFPPGRVVITLHQRLQLSEDSVFLRHTASTAKQVRISTQYQTNSWQQDGDKGLVGRQYINCGTETKFYPKGKSVFLCRSLAVNHMANTHKHQFENWYWHCYCDTCGCEWFSVSVLQQREGEESSSTDVFCFMEML